jgi:hypothetical protein
VQGRVFDKVHYFLIETDTSKGGIKLICVCFYIDRLKARH